jgi:DNA-binding Xre family transcriptional regulator
VKKRQVSYRWRLRDVMAEHAMFATTELVPLLTARGVCLSPSQVHRLVTGTPERLSLPVFAALCDIFTTDPSELITTQAVTVGLRKKVTASGESLSPATLAALGSKRARIIDPDQ